MQRLVYEALALEKKYGAEVAFTDAVEIADSEPVTTGLTAGALRYQQYAATITEATYNAFVAGNMQDMANAIERAHPVKVLYMKFSWNASGLNVTDLQIAVIFKVLRGSVIVNDIAATMRTVQWYESMRHEVAIAGPGDTGLGPNRVWILATEEGIPLVWIVAGVGIVAVVGIIAAIVLSR